MACTIAYTHFLTRINLSGAIYDLFSVWYAAPRDTDAGWHAWCHRGCIVDTTSFATARPHSHICTRSPLGIIRENARSAPASLINRSRKGCKSQDLAVRRSACFYKHGRSLLDIFSHYFLVLQYFRGYAEFGWVVSTQSCRMRELEEVLVLDQYPDQLGRSYSCREAGQKFQ